MSIKVELESDDVFELRRLRDRLAVEARDFKQIWPEARSAPCELFIDKARDAQHGLDVLNKILSPRINRIP